MGLFDGLRRDFINSYDIDWMLDLDFTTESSMRPYIKFMAVDTVVNFVSRTMSTVKFGIDNKEWEYILNVRPNSDCSSATFWQKFFYRVIADNEVLVIVSDDNQLLIADSFVRNEYAIYEDTFSEITVKGYTFKRTFKMSEVIYINYNNDKLEKFTRGLFDDNAELYGRVMEVAMRNNQIRASVSVDSTGNFQEDKLTRLQDYMDKMYSSFKTNSVAIIPEANGFSYTEHNNGKTSMQSSEELYKMITSLIDDIANMIGVPTALIYGEKTEMDSNIKAYKKLCIIPLIKKLQDELTVKVIKRAEYAKGMRIKVYGVLPSDPLELATQADKLISSGAFYIDEVRSIFEYEDLPDGKGKVQLITKNYEVANESQTDETQTDILKGGEKK